jgi:hypothetical protein
MIENANVREMQYQTGFTAAVVSPRILYHSLLVSCMLQEAVKYFRHNLQGRNEKWNCITTWHLRRFEILTVLLQKIQA